MTRLAPRPRAGREVLDVADPEAAGRLAALLRDNGRLIVVASSPGTLFYLAPVLPDHFDGLASLDEADKQVAAWRDAVKDGSARAGA